MSMNHLEEAYSRRAYLYDAINAASPWHALHNRITLDRLRTIISKARSPLGDRLPRVLDLAGGTGLVARELLACGAFVTLVDALPSMCELARRALPVAQADHYEIICADAQTFRDYSPSSYDVVVCTQALNFFREPDRVIETASRALRPGGILYFDIDTAHRWVIIEALAGHVTNALAIASDGVDVARNIVGADYYFHTDSALSSMLVDRSFDNISVSGMLHVVPLLHLFNQSADFLDNKLLDPAVQRLFALTDLEQLFKLETQLARLWPADSAGYHVFTAQKCGVTL